MKILFSDFDNTLYFANDLETTTKNVQSIRRFISEGNIFCIITGRTYMDLKPDLMKIDVPYTYLLCGDGAMLLDSTDYCLEKHNMDPKVIEETCKILKENGYDPKLLDGYNETTNLLDCIKVCALYVTTKEDGIKLSKELEKSLPVYAYASGKRINVTNKYDNKMQSIINMAELLKLNPKDFYIIGDDINDYKMLEVFNGAVIKVHNPLLDDLNLPTYKTLADYIEFIMKN